MTGLEIDIQFNFDIDKEILQTIIDGDGMPLDKCTETANMEFQLLNRRTAAFRLSPAICPNLLIDSSWPIASDEKIKICLL